MGDRYCLNLKCSHCFTMNEDVYYAPSCDFTTFKCIFCGSENQININFTTTIISNEIGKEGGYPDETV